MTVQDLRSEVAWKCNLLQALLAFCFQLDSRNKCNIQDIRLHATEAPAKKLRDFRDLLDKEIRRFMSTLRCRARPEVLYHRIIEPELGGQAHVRLCPKILPERIVRWIFAVDSGLGFLPRSMSFWLRFRWRIRPDEIIRVFPPRSCPIRRHVFGL